MDKLALARSMQALTSRIDGCWRPAGLIQHQFEGPPFGTAYVCISPGEESPHPSANHNGVLLCGADGGLTDEGIAHLIKLFGDAGVSRFFVWLSPGPDMPAVRRRLAEAGLTRRPFVSYPTLARDAGETTPVVTGFEVRELDAREVAGLSGCLDGVAWPEYLRSAGAPGVHHFMAFEADRPVASAVLCAFEGLGYLSMALTAEPFRRRGAQQALIARRIKKAMALGCTTLVSETLSILKDSLSNLQNAGFKTIYEKEVYELKPE